MDNIKAITINTPADAEAHIYAEDDAAIYSTIFGKDGVMNIGSKCAATAISNNKVRIADGVLVVDGHIARIPYGSYVDCEIANGQTGYNRNALIVAKFVVDGSGTSSDDFTLQVIDGVATSGTATDPALTQGNLYEGDKIRELPMYRVRIQGLSIVAVEELFETIQTLPEMQQRVADLEQENVGLNNDIENIKKHPLEAWQLFNSFVSANESESDIMLPNRSLSDFAFISILWYNGYIRTSQLIPVTLFKENPVSLSYVDSTNAQYWCEISYVSDTKIKTKSSSNASGQIYIRGVGGSKTY